MRDLQHPKWMYLKAGLLLGCGILSAGLLVARSPEWQTGLLLAICVWAFARAYYFAFYVIQHYIDPAYRFAGLIDFARYLLRRRH
jgi:uncharacterized RDD family membrane protein YckC